MYFQRQCLLYTVEIYCEALIPREDRIVGAPVLLTRMKYCQCSVKSQLWNWQQICIYYGFLPVYHVLLHSAYLKCHSKKTSLFIQGFSVFDWRQVLFPFVIVQEIVYSGKWTSCYVAKSINKDNNLTKPKFISVVYSLNMWRIYNFIYITNKIQYTQVCLFCV